MKALQISRGLAVTAIAAAGDVEINAGMLAGCRGGRNSAPEGLTTIGDEAFYRDRLHSIGLPVGRGSGGPFTNART
ncbi:MAG: hypothetical protein LBP88_06875 [Treponema sp.]|jgi:hypothetical protein|nr:hypothetical protein [Treponema sp.]